MAVDILVNTIPLSYRRILECLVLLALFSLSQPSPIASNNTGRSQELDKMRSSVSKRDTSPLSDINLSVNNKLDNITVPEHVHTVGSSQQHQEEDAASKCAKCSLRLNGPPELKTEQERDTVRELRLELVKAQILSKLKLTQPPNITRPLVLPPEAVEAFPGSGANFQDEEPAPSPSPLISKIIVADARVPCPSSSPRSAVCFHFSVPADMSVSDASRNSVFFWVPEIPSHRSHRRQLVAISKVLRSTVHHRRHRHNRRSPSPNVRSLLATHRVTRPDNGWVSINISSPLLESSKNKASSRTINTKKSSQINGKWEKGSSKSGEQVSKGEVGVNSVEDGEFILEIFCRHCGHQRSMEEGSTHMPFISLQVANESPSKSRGRRSTQDCGQSTRGCCRDSFFVNFSDLGWDDWIIQPSGFTMYFCRGSCAQPSLADALEGGNSYSSLLQRILLTDALSPAVRAAVAPCCSAHRAVPLSVMWMSSPNTVKLQHLPDMIVTECSCSG